MHWTGRTIGLWTLALAACGTGDEIQPGFFAGEARLDSGEIRPAAIQIVPTCADRVHLFLWLSAEEPFDSEGAWLDSTGVLWPDGGGMLRLHRHRLQGRFFSALGASYWLEIPLAPGHHRFPSGPGDPPGSFPAPPE